MGGKWAKQEIPGAQAPQQKVKEALKDAVNCSSHHCSPLPPLAGALSLNASRVSSSPARNSSSFAGVMTACTWATFTSGGRSPYSRGRIFPAYHFRTSNRSRSQIAWSFFVGFKSKHVCAINSACIVRARVKRTANQGYLLRHSSIG